MVAASVTHSVEHLQNVDSSNKIWSKADHKYRNSFQLEITEKYTKENSNDSCNFFFVNKYIQTLVQVYLFKAGADTFFD